MKRLIVMLMVVLATADDGDGDGTTGTRTTGPTITGAGTGTTGSTPIPVPDLVGLSASQARSTLETVGLNPWRHRYIYSSKPRGIVVKQQVDAGTEVRPGRRIQFTITKPIPRALHENPWGYQFHCCTFIRHPPSEFCSYFNCVPSFFSGGGWVIQCTDHRFSQSGRNTLSAIP